MYRGNNIQHTSITIQTTAYNNDNIQQPTCFLSGSGQKLAQRRHNTNRRCCGVRVGIEQTRCVPHSIEGCCEACFGQCIDGHDANMLLIGQCYVTIRSTRYNLNIFGYSSVIGICKQNVCIIYIFSILYIILQTEMNGSLGAMGVMTRSSSCWNSISCVPCRTPYCVSHTVTFLCGKEVYVKR